MKEKRKKNSGNYTYYFNNEIDFAVQQNGFLFTHSIDFALLIAVGSIQLFGWIITEHGFPADWNGKFDFLMAMATAAAIIL